MIRSFVLLHVLLSLLAAALLAVPCVASVAARPSDGGFRGWNILGVTAHPTNSSLVYIIDSNWVRAILHGRELASVSLDDSSQYLLVMALAVDANTNVVNVLLFDEYFELYSLETFTADLRHITSNVSLDNLLSPPLQYGDRILNVLVDSNSAVYLPRLLANGSTLVHVLSGGAQVDVWKVPFATPRYSNPLVAMSQDLLFFLTLPQYPATAPLIYILSTGSQLVATLNLTTNSSSYDFYNVQFAVSLNSGTIAIGSGYDISLFSSTGVPVSSFTYISPVDEYGGFRCLAFDVSERLLAVDYYDQLGVQIISSINGDLLGSWASPVPGLSSVRGLFYEQQTKSLVISQPGMRDLPVLRLDADSGQLVQEYPIIGRSDSCFPFTSTVATPSGNIYILQRCTLGRTAGVLVLRAISPSGQLRRDVVLYGWTYRMIQTQLVVDEERGRFVLLAGPRQSGNTVFQIIVFNFNGTNVFNASDPRIGSIGTGAQLVLVGKETLAVADASRFRIALFDLNNGAFSSNITVPTTTTLLATTYAGDSWYRSERTYNNITRRFTMSINQYTNGSLLTQYYLDATRIPPRSPQALSVDVDSNRLYSLQADGGYDSYSIVYWKLQPRDEQQQTGVEQTKVRRVQQSGIRIVSGERSSNIKRDGRSASSHSAH